MSSVIEAWQGGFSSLLVFARPVARGNPLLYYLEQVRVAEQRFREAEGELRIEVTGKAVVERSGDEGVHPAVVVSEEAIGNTIAVGTVGRRLGAASMAEQ